MSRAVFSLDKTYFDCIDDKGNCFIIYRARLELSFLKINYSGLIFSDSDGRTIEQSSLSKSDRPVNEDVLHLNMPSMHLNGSWERRDSGLSLMLYRDDNGKEVFWNCHHPKALARILYRNTLYQGQGYAETLLMAIKPWKLPIDELRWGRFLSKDITIIWIYWKGAHPLNKLFFNGELYEDATFKETGLLFNKNKYRLIFEDPVVIRKGKLAGVIAKMPWLKVLFSRRILRTVEIKYKSPASFLTDTNLAEKGWSLYEIVTWYK